MPYDLPLADLDATFESYQELKRKVSAAGLALYAAATGHISKYTVSGDEGSSQEWKPR